MDPQLVNQDHQEVTTIRGVVAADHRSENVLQVVIAEKADQEVETTINLLLARHRYETSIFLISEAAVIPFLHAEFHKQTVEAAVRDQAFLTCSNLHHLTAQIIVHLHCSIVG